MLSKINSVNDYLEFVSDDKKAAFFKLREIIKKSIPKEFTETLSYGTIGYVVSHAIYPSGYHCKPNLPLPFVNIAAQKNFIALYHMGIYASPALLSWFVGEYPKHCKTKLDMGKSCIRFKKIDDIPFALIEELVKKLSVKNWIELYESTMLNQK